MKGVDSMPGVESGFRLAVAIRDADFLCGMAVAWCGLDAYARRGGEDSHPVTAVLEGLVRATLPLYREPSLTPSLVRAFRQDTAQLAEEQARRHFDIDGVLPFGERERIGERAEAALVALVRVWVDLCVAGLGGGEAFDPESDGGQVIGE